MQGQRKWPKLFLLFKKGIASEGLFIGRLRIMRLAIFHLTANDGLEFLFIVSPCKDGDDHRHRCTNHCYGNKIFTPYSGQHGKKESGDDTAEKGAYGNIQGKIGPSAACTLLFPILDKSLFFGC